MPKNDINVMRIYKTKIQINSLVMLAAISLFILGCNRKPSLEKLKTFSAVETYPEETWLGGVENKRALIIVAHDDDDCAMSGTIAGLSDKGWKIWQISLVATPLKEGRVTHPATLICEGNELLMPGIPYRKGLDTMEFPYVPIPLDEMAEQFYTNEMVEAIVRKVEKFKPSVIFTLDHEMGGYGHPEHVYLGQIIIDLFQQGKLTGVERIYQSVYTDHMEHEILDVWLYNRMKKYDFPNPYEIAKQVHGIEGMPEPNVQVTIEPYALEKMTYLREYHYKARKNLRKFIPYYEDFDAQEYFGIFDREFFRVITQKDTLSK